MRFSPRSKTIIRSSPLGPIKIISISTSKHLHHDGNYFCGMNKKAWASDHRGARVREAMLFGEFRVVFRCNQQTGQRKLAFSLHFKCAFWLVIPISEIAVKTGRKELFYWMENECIQRIWRTLSRGLLIRPPHPQAWKKINSMTIWKNFYFSHFHPYINLDGRFLARSRRARSVLMDRYYPQMSAASPTSSLAFILPLLISCLFRSLRGRTARKIKNFTTLLLFLPKKKNVLQWTGKHLQNSWAEAENYSFHSLHAQRGNEKKTQIEAFNGAVM